ncbi:MAG: glycoside hydrolase [Bacteroidetes bacterium]|nr:glycoside hydrolase [Bacteroidota bacterium]
MSVPIKLAILWHQHQPYYRSDGIVRLPWVRLHATKDYLEMAEHLARVPAMHATINLVPSLVAQVEEYAHGATDPLLTASRAPTDRLTDDERALVMRQCFHANYQRMIMRSARYTELRERTTFTTQDLRDLIVHFHLAWTGEYARGGEPFASLIAKDRDYTEADKTALLDAHTKILQTFDVAHMRLAAGANIELSTTPYYHPILPLICDTNSAHEAMPGLRLPDVRCSWPEDAREHVTRSIAFHEHQFGLVARGMWPAEGSISDAALALMADEGIVWAASDETVLDHSLGEYDRPYGRFEHYFPRMVRSAHGSIVVFFRDHWLSDKVGFDYHTWHVTDAVNDFVNHIRQVRQEILREYGEDVLRTACVSVILDGENCWEHYERNGFDFVSGLYRALVDDPDIEPVTMSEAVENIGKANIRPIEHIVAGSWIGGNFKIWIGHPEKNTAWEYLAAAREVLAAADRASANYPQARTALLQAEGSDWFWWFGDDHYAEDRGLFDELFRMHLGQMYDALGVERPDVLSRPIIDEPRSSPFSSMHRAE